MAHNNQRTRSVRLQMESYWDAAYRLGPDGLANYRKKIERELIDEIKDVMTERSIDDFMQEVVHDAKAEYQRQKQKEDQIKAKAEELKNPEKWKKWDTSKIEKSKQAAKERTAAILKQQSDDESD